LSRVAVRVKQKKIFTIFQSSLFKVSFKDCKVIFSQTVTRK